MIAILQQREERARGAPYSYFLIVFVASGFARGRVRTTTDRVALIL